MAFGRKFGKDVTDIIFSMRDPRWEMVRDGGKTPSASCFEPVPDHSGWQPITTNMKPERVYLQLIHSSRYGIPQLNVNVWQLPEVGWRNISDPLKSHRAFRRSGWPVKSFDIPTRGSPPRVGMSVWNDGELAMSKVEDLFWQCGPCLPNNEVRSDA